MITSRRLIRLLVVGLLMSGLPLSLRSDPAPAVKREVVGPSQSPAAPGQDLYLVRYEIPAQTPLKPHIHEGLQMAVVESGVLTYHVLTGSVPVYQRDPAGKARLVRRVGAGETMRIHPGQWVVELSEAQHYGENRESVPLIIRATLLLHQGAPLSTPVAPATQAH